MSTLSQSIRELRKLAPGLNKAADDAAKIVQEVEKLLNTELNLGIAVDAQVKCINQSPDVADITYLSHRRVGGKFRIAVAVERCTEFPDHNSGMADNAWETLEETPWAECPRDVKLETFPVLPKLLEEIVKQVQSTTEKVVSTQQTLKEIMAAASNGGSK